MSGADIPMSHCPRVMYYPSAISRPPPPSPPPSPVACCPRTRKSSASKGVLADIRLKSLAVKPAKRVKVAKSHRRVDAARQAKLAMQRALRPRIDHQIQAMAYKRRKAAEKAREEASAEASAQVDSEQKEGELLLLERLCESMAAAEETPSRLDLENEIIGLQARLALQEVELKELRRRVFNFAEFNALERDYGAMERRAREELEEEVASERHESRLLARENAQMQCELELMRAYELGEGARERRVYAARQLVPVALEYQAERDEEEEEISRLREEERQRFQRRRERLFASLRPLDDS